MTYLVQKMLAVVRTLPSCDDRAVREGVLACESSQVVPSQLVNPRVVRVVRVVRVELAGLVVVVVTVGFASLVEDPRKKKGFLNRRPETRG